MASAGCEEFVIGTEHGIRRGERRPKPIEERHVRGLVRERRRSCAEEGLLDPLHRVQPRSPGGRARGACRPLGISLRPRRSERELGRQGGVSAGGPPGPIAAVRTPHRCGTARPRWMRWRRPQRARNDELGPPLGLTRAAFPVRAAAVGRDLVGRERRRPACAQGVGHDRRQRHACAPRERAGRPAAHVGIEPCVGVELGFCVGPRFLDGRRARRACALASDGSWSEPQLARISGSRGFC